MNILIAIIVLTILYFFANRIYHKYWNKGLNINVSFDQAVLTEGDTGYFTEIISNQNFLPIPSLWIKFNVDRSLIFKDKENVTVSDKCYKNDIFSILFYQKITKKLTFTASHRGHFTIKNIDVVASNLLLSDSLVTAAPCDTTLTVYPRFTDLKKIELPFNRIMGEVISKRYTYEDPFEFSRIRPYTQGDNPKDINWKATSKTGILQTNVHQHTTKQGVTFLFNSDTEGILKDDDLIEEGIRIIATLSTLFCAKDVSVSFYSNGHDVITDSPAFIKSGYGRQHCENLYRTLARLNLTADRQDFISFATKLSEGITLQDDSVVVLVSSAKDSKTCDFFDSINRTQNAFWIIPLRSSDFSQSLPQSDRILYWEVKI